ncbi:hypothetical protein [Streptococcus thoraltensis]|nr:hypothetical protein [Streptococcus thoraltensis]QBX31143.1 hypothetical protein Javan616_0050 [Streptococcus phage Javan616]
MQRMTMFTFKLPSDLLERLRAESSKRGITVAGYIRMVLLQELEEE